MAVRLAPSARQQFLDTAGNPYVGAKLFTYVAGTSTKQATYTTSAGDVANTNPIILDAAGRTPNGLWLTEGADYKFILAPAFDSDPPSSAIYSEDWIRGVNDGADLSADAGSGLVGHQPTSGAATTVQLELRSHEAALATLDSDIIYAAKYGAVGDGTADDTTALQNAFNAAVGKLLILGTLDTYKITALTIPAGVTVQANGSVFRKSVASDTAAITIAGDFQADTLSLSTPGNGTDLGIRVTGSNVRIGRIECTSDAVDSQYGVHFQSTGATAIENIKVDAMKVVNFRAAVLIYNVGLSRFDGIDITRYVTGVYLRDVYRSSFSDANLSITSASATGGPGDNGLLVESTLSSGASNNLRFSRWSVADAGEHALRFGGQLTIKDVWIDNVRTIASGNAGAAATGGTGIKILGATSVLGEKHKNFFISNCLIEDCSTTGDGIGNFAAIQLNVVDNVQVDGLIVQARLNTYSAWHGVSTIAAENVQLNNVIVRDAKQHAVRIYTSSALPAFMTPNKNIVFNGGYFGIESGITSSTCVMYEGGDAIYRNCSFYGSTLSGGNMAVRALAVSGSGAYQENHLEIKYINPGDTTSGPPLQGTPTGFTFDYKGLFYGTFDSQAADSSIFRDTAGGAGSVRIRKSAAWVSL